MGTKEGCGPGDCGACSIGEDGPVTCSCPMLAGGAGGGKMMTFEGMADHGSLHPVHKHVLHEAPLQCGFCTPGMIVAARNMLERDPDSGETA